MNENLHTAPLSDARENHPENQKDLNLSESHAAKAFAEQHSFRLLQDHKINLPVLNSKFSITQKKTKATPLWLNGSIGSKPGGIGQIEFDDKTQVTAAFVQIQTSPAEGLFVTGYREKKPFSKLSFFLLGLVALTTILSTLFLNFGFENQTATYSLTDNLPLAGLALLAFVLLSSAFALKDRFIKNDFNRLFASKGKPADFLSQELCDGLVKEKNPFSFEIEGGFLVVYKHGFLNKDGLEQLLQTVDLLLEKGVFNKSFANFTERGVENQAKEKAVVVSKTEPKEKLPPQSPTCLPKSRSVEDIVNQYNLRKS